MSEIPAGEICVTSINIGRFPDWMAVAFDLITKQSPRELFMNYVFPVADVLSVGSQTDTQALTTIAMAQLPDIVCIGVLLQADPDNADDVLLGLGTPNVAHRLIPGASFSADYANTNLLWVGSNGAGAVRVTFSPIQL